MKHDDEMKTQISRKLADCPLYANHARHILFQINDTAIKTLINIRSDWITIQSINQSEARIQHV